MTGLEDSPLIGNDTTRSRTRPYVPAMLKFTAPTPAQLVALVPRRAWRWMLRGAVFAMVLPVLLQWLLAYVVGSDARILPPQLQAAKNLLIVTAHPDDECLFFAPSILGVLDRNRAVTGGLLVMSTGVFYWFRHPLPIRGVADDIQGTIAAWETCGERSSRAPVGRWALTTSDASPSTTPTSRTIPRSGGIPT